MRNNIFRLQREAAVVDCDKKIAAGIDVKANQARRTALIKVLKHPEMS
jgi:hypothetical protein